jgi:hypothetical protein
MDLTDKTINICVGIMITICVGLIAMVGWGFTHGS